MPTTIFPVPLHGRIHAAFVLDYRTDKWATLCGKPIEDAGAVVHKVTEVTCAKCAESLSR
jgi:hypothetical protein